MNLIVCATIFWSLWGQKNLVESRENVKVWIHDPDVKNPQNWAPLSENEKNCHGYIFSSSNEVPIYLDTIQGEEFILPIDGSFTFEEISFAPIARCVKLKPFKFYNKEDGRNWMVRGEAPNVAVPDTERIPCFYDKEVFPAGFQGWTSTTKVYTLANKNGFTRLPKEYCKDPSGCICGNDLSICNFNEFIQEFNCTNPILPMGFCNNLCGAAILLTPKEDFTISKIEEALKEYQDVDTHVSKVQNRTHIYIQVIFAEKNFKGDSLIDAKNFYEKLDEEEFKVRKVELKLSGAYYVKDMSKSTFPLILGSLIGVLLAYAAIFGYYNSGLSKYSPSHLPRVNEFFGAARYKRKGSNLSFDTQSLGSSVMSLEKSFDNPMFGKMGGPSKDYGSTSSIASTHDNPLYDIQNDGKELVDIAEEETEE